MRTSNVRADRTAHPTREENDELLRRAKDGDLSARNELVSRNLDLLGVVLGRRGDRIPSHQAEDIRQEAAIGLLIAVDRFDLSLGTSFSTYACWWIRQRVFTYLREDHAVRVPKHAQMGMAKEYDDEGPEVEKRSGRRFRRVKKNPASVAFFGSLDFPPDLPAVLVGSEEELVDREADFERVREAVDCLDPLDREIVIRQFGLGKGSRESLAAIGKEHKLTRERIRQRRNRAVRKLQEMVIR